ncbi:MFS siderochrome iron transporter 1 [Exophiala dermatitidis]
MATTEAVDLEPSDNTVPQLAEKARSLSPEQYELTKEAGSKSDNAQTAEPWSTRDLTVLITAIWVITFTTGFQMQVMSPLLPYVYSEFRAHSLIPTASIVSSVVGAVLRLPVAKMLDVWGRALGFGLALLVLTLGIIMMAACDNVVTYCAASVFFFAGYDCMSYVLFVVIADHFSLKTRGIMFGLYNSPWLITTWIGAPVATHFLHGAGWRWAFGTFSIVVPISGLPLLALLIWSDRRAKRWSAASAPAITRTPWQSLKYYWVEFDCIGILLLAAGFSLFLLPFSLYTRQSEGWQSPMIICMIVFGGFAIILFGFWEKYLAPKSFIPYPLLKSRTVIGGSVSYAQTYLVYYCWTSYFTSSLQVVQGETVTNAGYIYNIHNIGWCVAGIAAGAFIKVTGRYKWLALFLGLPLQLLTTGLMIYLSKPNSKTGSIIAVQVFLSLGDGIIYMSAVIAVMAAIDAEHIATVLALYNMIGTTFQAVGATISVAVWTKSFPEYLAKNLPASAQSNLMAIYSDITTQLSYPKGTPERVAIDLSYSQAMEKLFITGTCIILVGVISTVVWRDIRVSREKSAGTVPVFR